MSESRLYNKQAASAFNKMASVKATLVSKLKIHKKVYLSFIALFKDALLRLAVVGFCERVGRGVNL